MDLIGDPQKLMNAAAAAGAPIVREVADKMIVALAADEVQGESALAADEQQAEVWIEALIDRLTAKYQLSAIPVNGKFVFQIEQKGK